MHPMENLQPSMQIRLDSPLVINLGKSLIGVISSDENFLGSTRKFKFLLKSQTVPVCDVV